MRVVEIDERRRLILPGDEKASIDFAVLTLLDIGRRAIARHGFFALALSGGKSPLPIYQKLSSEPASLELDWSKVLLFWSDERNVLPTDPESNYRMAMEEGGLSKVVKSENVFRMHAEEQTEEKSALAYEELIREKLKGELFDLVMLGMGEDGHTASLFPHTQGLFVINHLVTNNVIAQKKTSRMTLTFEAINQSKNILFFIQGEKKAEMLSRVLSDPYIPDELPAQRIGTASHPAFFIVDDAASKNILSKANLT